MKKNLLLSKISAKLTKVLEVPLCAKTLLQYYSFLTSNRIIIMAYYRTIDGVKYDGELLKAAEDAVAKDGSINMAEAEKLLEEVKDGNNYTDIEKGTMAYIRENFKWDEDADEWFRAAIRKWAANK